MELLWVGGFIALLGLIMRIAFRPQRVWLEETPEGCRVWVVGKEAKSRLKAEG
jgi:cytochrome c biogenesis protein ResB